jgi:Derlin-1
MRTSEHSVPRLVLSIKISALLLLMATCEGSVSSSLFGVVRKAPSSNYGVRALGLLDRNRPSFHQRILDLRGGASKKKATSGSLSKTVTGKKKVGAKKDVLDKSKDAKSNVGDVMQLYKNVLPLTRTYMTMVALCTLLGLILGDERTQAVLALDPGRVLFGMEFWRLITAASVLGQPSMAWIFNTYYLFQYGSALERAFGPAQFLVFLLTQIAVLAFLASLLGMPFFTSSVITGMLHVLSRATPDANVTWLVFKIPFWSLPYAVIVSDVLQSQSAAAAIPHVLGILSGHFYHFHRFIWPKTGGEDWLVAPDFLVEYMDPNSASRNAGKESISKALKSRNRGTGRKLGSA